jgi:glycosyltransferase involved in cell wall biosynthesis
VATKNLLAAAEQRKTIAQNARAEAERWSWSAATKQLANYYQQAIDQHK